MALPVSEEFAFPGAPATLRKSMATSLASERTSATMRVIERFVSDLEQNADSISSDAAIRAFRDIFVIKRLYSSALVEDVRVTALQLLVKSLQQSPKTPSTSAVLALVKTLSQIGSTDFGIATGNPAGGVDLCNIINNQNANAAAVMASPAASAIAGSDTATNSKNIGSLLEAINCIADQAKRSPKLLDGEANDLSHASAPR